mgnify:CR=1 FL=1
MRENIMNHTTETAIVKRALRAAGIPVLRVKHGTGTACEWLKVYLPSNTAREVERRAYTIAQTVTGRHGEHDGRINVFTQD